VPEGFGDDAQMVRFEELGDDAQMVRFTGAIGLFEPTLPRELNKS